MLYPDSEKMNDAGDVQKDSHSPDQVSTVPPTERGQHESDSLSEVTAVQSVDLELTCQERRVNYRTPAKQVSQKRSASDGAATALVKKDSSSQSEDPHMKRSSSEYDVRAASVRAKIEEKLVQIEKEMRLQRERSLESETFDNFEDLREPFKGININERQRGRSCSLIEMKATAISRLQAELDKAQKELKLKDEEVNKLSKIRDEVGAEIEDLTASLFEEANNMVRAANVKQAFAEKCAKEASMSLSILQEEVQALKSLVESTMSFAPPSYVPNSSQQVQNCQTGNRVSIFKKSPVSPKRVNCSEQQSNVHAVESSAEKAFHREQYEVDPCPHQEFVAWRQDPKFDKSHPFLQRIYLEDISPCMNFANKELATKVLSAVEENQIIIESVSNKSPLPKMCALLKAPRFCKYKMNLGIGEDWHYISVLGRNRITAVCDFFCYLRYIEKGLIKHSSVLKAISARENIRFAYNRTLLKMTDIKSLLRLPLSTPDLRPRVQCHSYPSCYDRAVHEVFLEILKKRRRITLARLGFPDTESQ